MLDTFLAEFSIQIEPVTAEQALLARQAFVLFGKGRHKAGLNFGDCFSYALAKAYREPLLFKGGDFGHTDLEAA
jgi:ribonuclease VapC